MAFLLPWRQALPVCQAFVGHDQLAFVDAAVQLVLCDRLAEQITLQALDLAPTDAEFRALALDATMNDSVRLSRIRPLGAAEVEAIFRRAAAPGG